MADGMDTKKICQEVQKAAMAANRAASGLPPTEDFAYHNSFPEYSNAMAECKEKINGLMNAIAKNYKCKTMKPFNKARGDTEKFEIICDLNDLLLDRASNWMDEAEGLKKKDNELIIATLSKKVASSCQSINRGQDNSSANQGQNSGETKTYHLLAAKIVQRPQITFKDKIDNSLNPFVPKIKEKPHSIKPLAILPETMSDGRVNYCHPYEFEIEKFEPSNQALTSYVPIKPPPMEETKFEYIETVEQLEEMVKQLFNCTEIAIDIEHHSFRTYQGFTCTIQITSRCPVAPVQSNSGQSSKSDDIQFIHSDYLIDALKLRSELSLLNEVTTNPRILKVFHGADMDILWLQRDFGVYIVNMFDTGQAARVLGLAHYSLAHLLKSYCGIEADKQFQLADWRMRPLPEQLVNYARSDTHHLLFIYDSMRNQLIDRGNETKNLLRNVYSRSATICLKRYEKPVTDGDAYLRVIQRNRIPFNPRQLHCLEQLYEWRDKIARAEDESTGYVLPNHMLLQLTQLLPREIQGILACCNPVPPLVKQNLNEIHAIIYKSREVPLDVKDNVRLTNQSMNLLKKEYNSYANHDDNYIEDNDDCHFNCILDGHVQDISNSRVDTSVTIMDTNENEPFASNLASCFPERIKKIVINDQFVSPYERLLQAKKEPPKMETDEVARSTKTENDKDVEKLFGKVAVNEADVEEFLGPIKKLKSESSVKKSGDEISNGPITAYDYKSKVNELFQPDQGQTSNNRKKQLYDPHGDYMKDANKSRSKGGGRSRSRKR